MSVIASREVAPPLVAAAHGARDQLRTAFRTIRASIHPAADEAWLTDAQLHLYRQGTRRAGLILAACSYFISSICAPWASLGARTAWWLSAAALGLVLFSLGTAVDRHDDGSLDAIRFRARWYLILTTVFVTMFGSMSVVLWVPDQPLDHILIIFMLACGLAASVVMSAVHPAIATTAFVINSAFIIGPLVRSGSHLDETMALLACAYVALLGSQCMALNRNITRMLLLEHERENLVDDLQRAKSQSDRESARAAQAARVKSRFLSNMSHELRTPMNAILGFSELIKNRAFGPNVERCIEYAEIIHDSGRHLLTLIDGVLDLGKIEGGRLSLRETEIDLQRLIADVCESHRQRAETARLSLVDNVARNLPPLRADERAVIQIVANLLANGIKFTPPRGCVTAFARVERDGSIAFGVEDTGIGIADHERAGIFERFGSNRHDVTTADRGMGLGLAIVKGLAEAHDGRVEIESALGSGTRVTVYSPAERVIAGQALKVAG